jgi:hypothetical protein
MKSRFLFPYQFKLLGWFLAVPGFILGYFVLYHDYNIPGFDLKSQHTHGVFVSMVENLTNELALVLVVLGLLFVAFSKERREDELTARMRYNALYWAILINYLIYGAWLIVALVHDAFPHGNRILSNSFTDILVIAVYNLFTPLVIFVIRYYYLKYRKNNEYKVDKLFYLPYKPFKVVGVSLSVVMLVSILLSFVIKWIKINQINAETLQDLIIFLPLALLLWAYSKEKNEDEFIATLRLESMQLAVYINYIILLIANCFLFFTDFMVFMFVNLSTIALFFVIRFNYILRKYNKATEQGELAS